MLQKHLVAGLLLGLLLSMLVFPLTAVQAADETSPLLQGGVDRAALEALAREYGGRVNFSDNDGRCLIDVQGSRAFVMAAQSLFTYPVDWSTAQFLDRAPDGTDRSYLKIWIGGPCPPPPPPLLPNNNLPPKADSNEAAAEYRLTVPSAGQVAEAAATGVKQGSQAAGTLVWVLVAVAAILGVIILFVFFH